MMQMKPLGIFAAAAGLAACAMGETVTASFKTGRVPYKFFKAAIGFPGLREREKPAAPEGPDE